MDIVHKQVSLVQKYYIYNKSKNRLHLNDANIDAYNLTFEALQELNTKQQHTRYKR
jgi:hypothetical protein